jgi:hypothetical protein
MTEILAALAIFAVIALAVVLGRWIAPDVTVEREEEPREVVVTITADTSAFVAAMSRAGEATSKRRYQARVANERSLARAYLGVRLDRLCADLGLDPVAAWRLPKWNERGSGDV